MSKPDRTGPVPVVPQGDPSWDDLRVALAVARAQSLAKGAETLGMDPATVSRRVSALEASLGAVLFVRARSGVSPTDAGRALIARASEMELRVMRLCDDVAAQGTAVGLVRLVTAPWIAVRVAGVVAPGLRRDHPGIELRLVATRPDWPPPPGEATLSLWCETPPQPGDFAIQFGEVAYALYGAPGTPPDAPATLAHAFDDGGARNLPRWATAQNAPDRWAQARLRPGSAFALTATDSLVLREAARAGLGAALLPICIAEDDPGLVRLDPSGPVLRRPLMLHAHPDTVQFARVQVVIDALRRAAAALFGVAA